MSFLMKQVRTTPLNDVQDKSFDFIVVGSGSAGAVVAARLSEDPAVTVLLLEAGDEATELEAKIPAAAGKLQNKDHDWQYSTEPSDNEEYAVGLQSKRNYWPRGKCLGGSSVLNYMAYVRGCREDYDGWEALGAKGWGYKDVLPFFQKAENNECISHDLAPLESAVHGAGGPLSVELRQPLNPLATSFVRAAKACGFEVADYNRGDQDNTVSLLQQSCHNGQRCGTDFAYLKPASARPNLSIVVNAQVGQVLTETGADGLTANGVQIVVPTAGGKASKVNVFAKKEVILSGGTIGSPHVLMLSGIGPKEELEAAGVECKLDLQDVGKNMEDHLALGLRYNAKDNKDIGSVNGKKAEGFPGGIAELFKWALYGTGLLASSAYDATLFCKSSAPSTAGPDLQIGILCSPGDDLLFYENVKFEDQFLREGKHLQADSEGVVLVPTLLHMRNRGELVLTSADPFVPPKIYPKYLDNEEDRNAAAEVALLCNKLVRTQPLADLLDPVPVMPKHLSDKHGGDHESPDYWKDHFRCFGTTLYHPTSSAKIGKVVDERLRVYAVNRLRVCDASIMPTITSGNTNAPSIMVGEKGASLIAEDHSLQQTLGTNPRERTGFFSLF